MFDNYGYSQQDKESFSSLHFYAFLIHLVSAILATNLTPGVEFATQTLTFTQYDYTSVDDLPTILTSTIDFIRNANPILLVALNEWITCASHVIGFIIVNRVPTVDTELNGWSRKSEYTRRWIEYAITAGLLEIAFVIGLGETNMLIILIILINNIALQLIGWSQDIQKNVGFTMVSGFILLFTVILVLATHVINQVGLQMEWGYLVSIFSIFYASFGVHQTLYVAWDEYREMFDVDKIYICLSMTAKIVLSWTFIGIYRKSFVRLGKPMVPKVWWEENNENTWDWIIGILAFLGVFFIVIFYYIFGKSNTSIKEEKKALRDSIVYYNKLLF
jgi:hypothetical protein